MWKFILLVQITIACVLHLNAQQKKEQDFDVNYSEEKVPPYVLPEILATTEGNLISTANDWYHVRRPQILALFSNLIYGQVPLPTDPLKTATTIRSIDKNYLEGKAVRKVVQIDLSNSKGKAVMNMLIIHSNADHVTSPALMQLSFDKLSSDKLRLDPDRPNQLQNGVPIAEILASGFAYIAIYQQDLIAHNETEFKQSIQQLFFDKGQSFPKGHEWGVIATISWSASRGLDYLQEDASIDETRVAIMGHSKLGKAALWAAAQDQRFAMVISAQSGCAGAALWRRKFGETLAKMSIFPHWLCNNARKFIHREDDLPVDQHMLLASIAPRPLYIASAEDDLWADPRGEFLSAYHASKVYKLLGKKGLNKSAMPPPNQPILEQDMGYHLRTGGHSVEKYDWKQFLFFMQYHLK